ncbi:Tn3 family transposase [Dyadobacter psychrotolerans]|uniref:Tn3 family transposase n=1 Tax=Dyadobacter psychrotolerans TaxID=2541721 RepID=A0A4R5DCK8_9BACT|nr:Tn3 family transposase [Dyadobacter psychrotolerans]TDE09364.1 Tn3 family transposase [Dyadobacter psychrotolerans]
MPRKEYLTSEERTRFDNPPILNADQRPIFLEVPQWAAEYVKTLQTPSNKVGFLLQVGYFRIVSRFFGSNRFHQSDVDYVAERISVDVNAVQMTSYEGRTSLRHREDILLYFGFAAFEKSSIEALTEETQRLAHVQTRPYLIFEGMVGFLQAHHIEIPTYQSLKTILDKALASFEQNLESILSKYLTAADVLLLDQLLVEHSSYQEDSRRHLKVKRYEITFFKRVSQSMETKQIHERVTNFRSLKTMYLQLLPVAKRLKLSDPTIQFYAEYVINNQVPQIATRSTNRYLLLISFIIHQYYMLGDALILTLNSAVTNYVNGCENLVKQELYQNRMQTAQLVSSVANRSNTHIDVLGTIEKIIADTTMEPLAKVTLIEQLFKNKRLSQKLLQEDQKRLKDLKETNQKINDREDFYQMLEKNASKLNGKVSDIVKVLIPSASSSGKDILAAVRYYQEKNGAILTRASVPTNFLGMEQQQRVLTSEGKLRTGLYKVFLFQEIRDNIKSGALPIDSSYDYRSFDEYEIPPALWNKEKEKLIEQAGLTAFADSRKTLLKLNERLNAQIKLTNEHIEAGSNKQVYFDPTGDWHLMKDKRLEEITDLESLYPQEYVIPLIEVLSTVQNATGFISSFIHGGIDHIPKRPEENLFFAAILGFGCNIGIRKFSFMSKGIRTSSLETTALQYFSPETVIQANDKVLAFSNALPLTQHYRKGADFVHTSSDGQKFDVSVASLVASPSFKYFGNGRGVTMYSFLDEAGQLFYSTVFSAAEPESHYVLDGLTHNEVIISNAHSTDTHGFSEPVFAVTGLLGIEFRPRFARFHHQQLYSIDEARTYRELNYKIVPGLKINLVHLENHWDEILRLVCTIKLGYAKASTLFRRLNSYSKQHPLYKALKDLGRLYKTAYVYQYMDDELIRKSVSGSLSKIESSNNFSKAITVGNNQELIWATRKEQLTAEGCKRLIANAVNTYNLLLLSEKLVAAESEENRKILLKKILATSTHSWAHINLVGEYDFSDGKDYKMFDLGSIMDLNLTP